MPASITDTERVSAAERVLEALTHDLADELTILTTTSALLIQAAQGDAELTRLAAELAAATKRTASLTREARGYIQWKGVRPASIGLYELLSILPVSAVGGR